MRLIKVLFSILFLISVAFTVYLNLSDNVDLNAPVIECSADKISVSVKSSDAQILKYVKASDAKDGDLTKGIIIESISPFVGSNTAKITFAVCDSDNNVSKLEKDIEYTDYSAPVFNFSQPHVYYVGATKVDLLAGVTATDLLDGDISRRVVIAESKIDLSQPGVYPVTYRVTTSKGITSEISINAYVYSSRLKTDIVLKDYLIYSDSEIDPEEYIEEYPEEYLEDDRYDNYDYEFDIIDEVDYTNPGIYYITYRLTRSNSRNDDEPEIIAESYLAVAVRG